MLHKTNHNAHTSILPRRDGRTPRAQSLPRSSLGAGNPACRTACCAGSWARERSIQSLPASGRPSIRSVDSRAEQRMTPQRSSSFTKASWEEADAGAGEGRGGQRRRERDEHGSQQAGRLENDHRTGTARETAGLLKKHVHVHCQPKTKT